MPDRNAEQTSEIADRFQGLPDVAHGGYVAGALAAALGCEDIEVRLRRPVPTGRRLDLERVGERSLELREGETLLAEAVRTDLSIETPAAVTLAEAEAASRRFLGFERHPVPNCLVCGTDREAADGLRVFPGPVAGRRLVAAPWLPDPATADREGYVPGQLASAALDCAQLWGLIVHSPAGARDAVVTAGLELSLRTAVVAGEPHVVVGWPIGREGRAWLAGAAVYGPGGQLCAVGRQKAAVASWGVPLGLRAELESNRTT